MHSNVPKLGNESCEWHVLTYLGGGHAHNVTMEIEWANHEWISYMTQVNTWNSTSGYEVVIPMPPNPDATRFFSEYALLTLGSSPKPHASRVTFRLTCSHTRTRWGNRYNPDATSDPAQLKRHPLKSFSSEVRNNVEIRFMLSTECFLGEICCIFILTCSITNYAETVATAE